MLQYQGKEQMAVNGLFKDYAIARFTDCSCYSYWPTYILYRGSSRCSSHIGGLVVFLFLPVEAIYKKMYPANRCVPNQHTSVLLKILSAWVYYLLARNKK